MKALYIFLIYFFIISLVTSIVTILDKHKAKKGKYRISEATLFILAIIGGALSEYLTMLFIRHKTLHKRFMIGLPVIIILQLTAIVFILTKLNIFSAV